MKFCASLKAYGLIISLLEKAFILIHENTQSTCTKQCNAQAGIETMYWLYIWTNDTIWEDLSHLKICNSLSEKAEY
jgi:hypothetical protein